MSHKFLDERPERAGNECLPRRNSPKEFATRDCFELLGEDATRGGGGGALLYSGVALSAPKYFLLHPLYIFSTKNSQSRKNIFELF